MGFGKFSQIMTCKGTTQAHSATQKVIEMLLVENDSMWERIGRWENLQATLVKTINYRGFL